VPQGVRNAPFREDGGPLRDRKEGVTAFAKKNPIPARTKENGCGRREASTRRQESKGRTVQVFSNEKYGVRIRKRGGNDHSLAPKGKELVKN